MKNPVRLVPAAAAFAAAAMSAAVFMGCSIDSGETTSRTVSINVEGVYTGSPLVQNNTGAPITSMNVRQSGDGLEGIDNNGIIFKGSIGRVDGESQQASFTLVGSTTAGQEGTMAGTITVSGTTGTMQGTWAEPTLFSSFAGTATVAMVSTNSSSITISGSSTVAAGGTATYTVSGASGTVTWGVSGGGSVSPTSGSSTTTFTAPGSTTTVTISASDSSGSDTFQVSVN